MIQNDSNRATQVKQRFIREYNIKVLDEWLSGCVSFCLQENSKISNESLFQFALSQWLLADLNDVGVGAFPPGLDGKTEAHTLAGTFPVQMQFLIDISEPAYDQWRDMHDKKLDEAEDEVQMRKSQAPQTKKRRMLKLELTDGKQTIVAMEHTPIRCLSTKLAPGAKLLLSGPIRCINKVLFLEPKNVRVLGGEVDILLISHAYENVLLRALNKPANPNPKIDYEEAEAVEMKHRANHGNIQPIPMLQHRSTASDSLKHHGVINVPALPVDDVDDDSLLLGIDLEAVEGSQQPQGVPTNHLNKPEQVACISTLMDDDELDDIVNLVDEPEPPEIMNQQVSSTKTSQPFQPSPQMVRHIPMRPKFVEPDDDDLNMMNSLENQIQSELRTFHVEPSADNDVDALEPPSEKKSRITDNRMVTPPRSVRKSPPAVSLPASRSSLQVNDSKQSTRSQEASSRKTFNRFSPSDLFEDSSIDCMELNDPEPVANILSPGYAFRIGDSNLATIDQIMALSEVDRAGASFVVYAEVIAVTEQPRIRKERWHLAVQLTDESQQFLSVQLHNDLIAEKARYDAGELMRLHKVDRDGVMKLLDTILAELKELLQDIKCFWRVEYPSAGDAGVAVATVVYEMNDERGAILLDKIIKENCTQLRQML